MKNSKKYIFEKFRNYWEQYEKINYNYLCQLKKIEKDMSKEAGIPLEFFHVDGEVVGIGAKMFKDRKKFRLLRREEFRTL